MNILVSVETHGSGFMLAHSTSKKAMEFYCAQCPMKTITHCNEALGVYD